MESESEVHETRVSAGAMVDSSSGENDFHDVHNAAQGEGA